MDSESPDVRNARTLSLWKKLDTQNEGSLDVKALKRGLKKLDHRKQPTTLPNPTMQLCYKVTDITSISLEERRRPYRGYTTTRRHKQ